MRSPDSRMPAQARRVANDAVTDAGFALRSFRRSPGWTLLTLLTIALGVGASTAVFSVADTFLIRPLAYRDASRVYAVSLQGTVQGEAFHLPISTDIVRAWRTSARTTEATAAYDFSSGAFLHGDVDDRPLTTAIVDSAFLAFAGARPLIGRSFTAEEMLPNGPRAIMLSEGLWRRQFGASRDVLGKVVRLDVGGNPDWRPSIIVGVMPASAFLPDFQFGKPDVWLPLNSQRRNVAGVAVRVRPGVSKETATEELTAIVSRAGGLDPDFAAAHPQIRLSRPQDELPFRQALILLTGAVVFLLLIACSNVSHLMLQRGVSRERELAVRHALGAHRARLVRQLVTESTLLGLAGGVLAMLVGWGALNVLARLRPISMPALSYLSTTRGVIPLAAGLAIAVGLTVGVLGALHVAHEQLGQSLRSGASSATLTHRRLRGTLVVGQIALSAILLAGAILLIRAVFDFERVRLGFDPHGLYAVSFRSRDFNTPMSPESVAASGLSVREEGERVLGSRDLALAASATPEIAFASAFETREHPGAVGSSGITGVNYVAPDYFSIMRMPLLAGRTFDAGPLSRDEVIVSRSLAQQLGYHGTIVGQQFRNSLAKPDGSLEPWLTVVGVAPDILANRLDGVPKPMLYRPFPGNALAPTLIVRWQRKDALDRLRRFASSVQPDRLTWTVNDVDEKIEQSIAEPRFTMFVLVLFAVSGLLLAAIGLFGVMSYSLSLRTREIGVRFTLGATRRNIAGLFVRDALGQAALGAAIGLTGAAGVARVIRMSFFGVQSFDTTTFILAAASILVASLAACAGPLFRATMIDPAVAIRAE